MVKTKHKRSLVFTFFYGTVVVLRVFTPFFIFFQPVTISLLAFLLDVIDVEFASRRVLTKSQYQYLDKAMDFWWYVFAMVYSFVSMPQYNYLLIPLFTLRLLGEVIFYFNRNRKTFFYFPNLFENAYFIFLLGNKVPSLGFLISGDHTVYSLAVVFILKMFQEWWVHIAQISIGDDIINMKRQWLT
ncbi:hypothetical protein GYA28_01955 [Candidatus Roizmanbacteria bacterium]|jgi:hypothetical protein|nr:hypothetical protein [Candidatus Roizmanbacteria bacterium]